MDEKQLRELVPPSLLMEHDSIGSKPGIWEAYDIYRTRRGDHFQEWIASIAYYVGQPDKQLTVWEHGDNSPANILARMELAQLLGSDVGFLSSDFFRAVAGYAARKRARNLQ